jgi:hypothetical protein
MHRRGTGCGYVGWTALALDRIFDNISVNLWAVPLPCQCGQHLFQPTIFSNGTFTLFDVSWFLLNKVSTMLFFPPHVLSDFVFSPPLAVAEV